MATRIGINGFGRIGRNFFRAHLQRGGDFEVVAANDLGDAATMAHLLKFDSVLGPLGKDVQVGEGSITVEGQEIKILAERDPGSLPWGDLGVDVVIESTGFFTDREAAAINLIPTSTGAARAIGLVLPELQGKVDGMAMRAPVPTGSIVDLVCRVGRETSAEEVNEIFSAKADTGNLEGILSYSEEALV